MRTQEVEDTLGITKQTILFYEKEGLLQPKRDDNGYRNYTEADIQTLKLIKLLRSLDISIDDIKGVLDQTVSFQECLRVNDQKISQTMDSLQDMKQTISYLKESKLPMIPALADIDTTSYPFTFGFKKTNKTASLGRKLTTSLARKRWLEGVVITVLLEAAIIYGMASWTEVRVSIVGMLVLGILIFFLLLASGFQMHSFSIDMSRNQYIEFLEDRVCCYRYQGIGSNIRYLWYAMIGKTEIGLETYSYSDITKLEIRETKRYMKIPTSNLSTEYSNYDFIFTFSNGKTMYLYNPMTFGNDRYLVATILEERVGTIIDPHHVVETFKGK